MEERIIQLETLSALQDETIKSLNQEIFRQQQEASMLRKRLDTLESKVAEMQHPQEIGSSERPPHY